MTMEKAVKVWEKVAEWERDTFGSARSSLTIPTGSAHEYELQVPQIDRRSEHAEEIDLLELADIVAGHGAGLFLHSTGGLVIR